MDDAAHKTRIPTFEMSNEIFLAEAMAKLTVRDEVRRSNQMNLPGAELVLEFEELVCEYAGDSLSKASNTRERECITDYGVPVIVIAKIWELLADRLDSLPESGTAEKHHLLWALHKLKCYSSESSMCKHFKHGPRNKKPDPKTFRKWASAFIREIYELFDTVILWENRKIGDVGHDCLTSVDCTDCPFQQIRIADPNNPGKTKINKALYTKKFNGPALRYEIAVSLVTDRIVWVNGPFLPGLVRE